MPLILDRATGSKTDIVTKGHLHNRLAKAILNRPRGLDLACLMKIVEGLPSRLHALGRIIGGSKQVYGVSRFLEFGRQNLARLDGSDCKGDQGRRNIFVKESSRHRILAADSRRTKLHLRIHSAKQCREGLAPTIGLVAKLLKELLKSQVSRLIISACRYKLCHRIVDRGVRARVRIDAHIIGIQTPSHNACILGALTGKHGKKSRHCLCGGLLGLSAEGHQHRTRTDRAVKTLNQTSAACGLKISRHLAKIAVERCGKR